MLVQLSKKEEPTSKETPSAKREPLGYYRNGVASVPSAVRVSTTVAVVH